MKIEVSEWAYMQAMKVRQAWGEQNPGVLTYDPMELLAFALMYWKSKGVIR